MVAAGPGIGGIVSILLLLGGVGLPLGVPPASEDPLLARVAPDECVFYAVWSGSEDPDPGSANQTEQLLAEPEVQELFAQLEEQLLSALRDEAAKKGPQAAAIADDVARWAKRLLTSPKAVFVSHASMGPEGPDVSGGVLIKIGADVAQVQRTLEKYQTLFLGEAVESVTVGNTKGHRITLDEGVPEITWGVKGQYLLIGVGKDAFEGMVTRAGTPPPKWLTELREQLPVERMATLTYVNVGTLIDTFAPLGGPQVAAALDAAGLGNVTSAAAITGLDGEGTINRMLLGLDGEPQGLLAALTAGSLTADDLAPISRDATLALALRLDPAKVLQAVLEMAGKIEPDVRAEILEGIAEIEQELAVNVRDDLLDPLGDVWCVYNSPGEGGLVFTGLTAVVKVDDRATLAALHDKLLAVAKAELGRHDDDGPRIEEFEFAGQKVFMFNARDDEFPLAPSWCLTENELIVAPFPQNVKAYLSRGDDVKSLAAAKEVAAEFDAGGPLMLTYVDTPKLFELLYPILPPLAQVACSALSEEGIDVNASLLPSAPAIGRHLRPSVAVVRRSEAGIEMVGRQTVPGGNLVATAPVTVALLLPAVQAARESARRAQSMNNLKQIALAMHNYASVHGSFPPAYSTDDEGNPLLSWRVLILPYLEEQALYEQFKLDEPWDSEHNRPLSETVVGIYQPAGSKLPQDKTNYLTVRGENTAFPGKEKISMAHIRDGTSNTIMVIEAADEEAVIWTKPDDFVYDEDDPVAGLVGLRPGGFIAAMCDGSVHFLSESIDPKTLKRLFTRNDAEPIDRDELR